ncbi:MAG: CDP-alcohol phosphatidyltransferase family protein [Bdellovibrionales bacterium]|nr:CDP-alcohol phosphatidyltransferase family protein [Bdellovibrionales bacterium]
MIDTSFRKFFGQRMLPLTKLLARLNVSPNAISLLAFLISSSAGLALGFQRPQIALILWWTGRILDSLDGELARLTGKTSPFGAFLDITLDMMAYSAVIVGFFFYQMHFQSYWLVIMFLYVGCITSALSLGVLLDEAKVKNTDNRGLRLATGLAEGGETGIAYSAFILLPSFLSYLLPAWIMILAVTIVARFTMAYRLSRKLS